MPGLFVHLVASTPLSLGYKWLNLLSLLIASVFPDILAVLVSPVLIFVFGLRGERLNWFFTFFDQSIIGGAIGALVLIGAILLLIRFCPRLSKPFKWKQNYSTKAIVISVFLGVAEHILLDKLV